MKITIEPGFDAKEEIRTLFLEYTDMLCQKDPKMAGYLGQQNYEEELRHLEDKYGPPRGRLYLARVDGEAAGCVAMHPLGEDRCELKRLYVRPQFRGHKLGRLLSEKVIEAAREEGYPCLLLDSLDFLKTAIALYRELGFYESEPHLYSPMDCSVFMRLDLK